MKKIITVFLACFLLLLTGCGKTEVKVSSIEVDKTSIPESAIVEEFDISTIKLIVTMTDKSTSKIDVTKDMLSEEDNNKLSIAGTYTITINYEGKTTTFDITLKEKIKNFKVKFVDYDGKVLKEETVMEGKSATAPKNPERTGYKFIGWDIEFNKVTSDLEVKAIYEINKYTITFYNGSDVVETKEVEYNATLTDIPEVPVKTGYNGKWDIEEFNNITKDIEVHAVYTINKYTVKFYNGEELVYEEEVEYGKGVFNIPAVPEKEGYTGKWDVEDLTYITKDITVKATYEVTKFKVYFYNGKDLVEIKEVEYGKDLTDLPKVPEKEGYIGKWDVEEFKNIKNNIDVHAVYEIMKFTVNFYVDEKIVNTYTIEYGKDLQVLPEVPAKENYVGSWDVEEIKNVTKDIDVHAIYTLNGFTVNFYVGEEIIKTYIVENGKELTTIPDVPVKEHYTGKWDVTDFTNITADLDVHAVYEIEKHTVTFYNGTEVIATVEVEYDGSILKADMPNVPVIDGYKVVWDKDELLNVITDLEVHAVATKYTLEEVLTLGEGIYAVEGTVVSTCEKSFVLTDGTNYILVYLNNVPEVKVGDYVSVNGTVTKYAQAHDMLQFDTDTVVEKIKEETYSYPEAHEITLDELKKYEEDPRVQINYVTITGIYNASGKFYNITLEGTKLIGSIAYPNIELVKGFNNGDKVVVSGYLIYIVSDKYLNVMATNIKVKEMTNEEKFAIAEEELLKFDGKKINANITLPVVNEKLGLTYNWTSDNEAISKDGVYVAPTEDTIVTLTCEVKINDISLGTVTVKITALKKQSGEVVVGPEYNYTFDSTIKPGEILLGDLNWNFDYVETYLGFDGGKGIQFGSNKKPTHSLTISTTEYTGGINKIVVNACGASGTGATMKVIVNGVESNEVTFTTSSQDFEFEVNGSGKIEIVITNTAKAFYIKSIAINPATL